MMKYITNDLILRDNSIFIILSKSKRYYEDADINGIDSADIIKCIGENEIMYYIVYNFTNKIRQFVMLSEESYNNLFLIYGEAIMVRT